MVQYPLVGMVSNRSIDAITQKIKIVLGVIFPPPHKPLTLFALQSQK